MIPSGVTMMLKSLGFNADEITANVMDIRNAAVGAFALLQEIKASVEENRASVARLEARMGNPAQHEERLIGNGEGQDGNGRGGHVGGGERAGLGGGSGE